MNPTQKRMLSILKRVNDERKTGDGRLTPLTANMVQSCLDDSARCSGCHQPPYAYHKMSCSNGSGLVDYMRMPRVRVKEGWDGAGKRGVTLGPAMPVGGMDWVPVLFDNEIDPTFFKLHGLEIVATPGTYQSEI